MNGNAPEESPRAREAGLMWPDILRRAGLDPDGHRAEIVHHRTGGYERMVLRLRSERGGDLALKLAWNAPKLLLHHGARTQGAAAEAMAARGGEYAVPPVIHSERDPLIVLMPWVPGWTAQAELSRARTDAERHLVFQRCCRWVMALAGTDMRQENLSDFALVALRQAKIGLARTNPSKEAMNAVTALADAVETEVTPRLGSPVQQGWSHGDMNFGNLVFGEDGKTYGVDLAPKETLPVEVDLSTLLVAFAVSGKDGAEALRLWQWAASFLIGIGADPDMLRIQSRLVLMQFWFYFERGKGATGPWRANRALILQILTAETLGA